MGRRPNPIFNIALVNGMDDTPEQFTRTTIEMHGGIGAEWLSGLPVTISDCKRRWSLTVHPPFGHLSYNYVAPAFRSDGTPAVLKLGFPNRELKTEIAALRLFDGQGIVRLLDADPEQGCLLLEHLKPGTPLSELNDDAKATSIAARVMSQLWRPVPPGHLFPSVADWASGLGKLRQRFDGTTGPLPRRLVEEAESRFAELISSMGASVLLHGDLHHGNILAAERQPWLAIDPKGVVGEPAYEVGALLRNLAPHFAVEAPPGRILERRMCQLAEELGFDRERLRAWGLAQAVLSAWWSVEDHGHGWEWAISCAELLSQIEV